MQTDGCVILSFNHAELSRQCVQSALQFYPPESILLFHNGSDLKITDELQEQFPQLHHSIQIENTGYAGGAQKALETGFQFFSRILLLTNDTRLVSHAPFTNQKGIGVPKILLRNHKKIDSCGGYLKLPSGELTHLREFPERFSPPTKDGFYYAPGTAFFIDAESFKDSGGFDSELFMYWEDVLWSFNAQKKGVHLYALPEVVLDHGVRRTTRGDKKYIKLFAENKIQVLKKILI
jgi:GT2 family glycosyltransferase